MLLAWRRVVHLEPCFAAKTEELAEQTPSKQALKI
jgi:hypothetical protein